MNMHILVYIYMFMFMYIKMYVNMYIFTYFVHAQVHDLYRKKNDNTVHFAVRATAKTPKLLKQRCKFRKIQVGNIVLGSIDCADNPLLFYTIFFYVR